MRMSLFLLAAVLLATVADSRCDEPKAKKEAAVQEHQSGKWTPGLTDKEKQTLFAIAEDTLKWCVGGSKQAFSFDKYELTDKLKAPTGTFVTLKIQGRLRGCIGSLVPREPLYRSVHSNAINASTRDFRFRPVTPGELARIDVHISILSPIVEIPSLDKFQLGAHGIIVEKGRHCAVYLPEVAVEQKWTKEETLSSLSQKAGMGPQDWRQGATFKTFSSVVLSKE